MTFTLASVQVKMESDVDTCGFSCCEPGLCIVLVDPETFRNIVGEFLGEG